MTYESKKAISSFDLYDLYKRVDIDSEDIRERKSLKMSVMCKMPHLYKSFTP